MAEPSPDIVLLGDPVDHSLSPVFQNAGLRAIGSRHRYGVRRVDPEGVLEAVVELREGRLVGLNVTVPHKSVAAETADEVTDAVAATGAANTLFLRGATVMAANTDVLGVSRSLNVLAPANERGADALLLGAGGAAAAAAVALNLAGFQVTCIARNGAAVRSMSARCGFEIAHLGWSGSAALRSSFASAHVIVHATSAGLAGTSTLESVLAPLPFDAVSPTAAFLDLSYGAAAVAFLARAPDPRRRMDGATMLLHQGAAAFELWTGASAPIDAMRVALAVALSRDPASIG